MKDILNKLPNGEQNHLDRTPLNNLTRGIGVSQNLIERYMNSAKRFDYVGTESIDLYTFPRDQRTKDFFRGESRYDLEKGEYNLVNNPLNLIRPATLQSVTSFFEENGRRNYPKYYADDRSERGFDDFDKEKNYMYAIKSFESLLTQTLHSLNEPDFKKRRELVKYALEKIFNPQRKELYLAPPYDIKKASPAESPQGWLVFTVLNILENTSEEITPVGRLRALELLELYPANELFEGFRSEKYKSRFYNGYDRVHIPRIPYSFCSRDERLENNHKDIWKRNPKIQKLIIKNSSGGTIDWKATANAIIRNNPEEAVQIALLFLHDYDLSEGAIALLRSIPKLDRETLSLMLGKKASFLIEHRIKSGMSIEDLTETGIGIKDSPEVENTPLTLEEVLQQLRRETGRVKILEEDLVLRETTIATLMWEKTQNELTNKRLIEELNYWRAGQKPRIRYQTVDILDQIDPNGYLRILGVHPSFFDALSENEIQELLQRHYWKLAKKLHPDKGGNEEEFKKLGEAYETLNNPHTRKKYIR